MDWHDIIRRKKQIKYFEKEKIDSSVIREIFDEFHEHCPSKQNMTPYTITVIPNKGNKELKTQIFYDTWCNSEDSNDVRNTQVLAPYTLLFKGVGSNKMLSHIEIGIASTFIAYAAVNRGLEISFCACYKNDNADLILSIGHRSTTKTYFNPLLNREVPQLDWEDNGRDTGHVKKPLDEYVIWK